MKQDSPQTRSLRCARRKPWGDGLNRTLLDRLVFETAELEDARDGKAAAVLLPLVVPPDNEGPMRVWMIRRPDTMRTHAGQVAFPGGKCDPEDPSHLETALREAEEEIGLHRSSMEVIGRLRTIRTGMTGYRVAPFVALVPPTFVPVPNPMEVARVFSVPFYEVAARLDERFDPRLGIHHEGEHIWGASAAMIVDLFRRMR